MCSLSGEDLKKDEDLRKELKSKEEKGKNLGERGRFDEALEILKEEVELMEANWDKFSGQVWPPYQSFKDHYSQSFSSDVLRLWPM